MRKSMVFEGVIAILIIPLLFTMYLMVTSGGSSGGESTRPAWVSSIYPGKDGTSYAFAGSRMATPSTPSIAAAT